MTEHVPALHVPSVDETLRSAVTLSRAAYRLTTAQASRAYAVLRLLDRADAVFDDLAGLRQSAQFIADNLAELSKSAAGLNDSTAEIACQIKGLTKAAQGIDENAEHLSAEIEAVAKIVPTLQRLTEIVDPLDNTVVRLGRFVDRLPGRGRRTPNRRASKPPP